MTTSSTPTANHWVKTAAGVFTRNSKRSYTHVVVLTSTQTSVDVENAHSKKRLADTRSGKEGWVGEAKEQAIRRFEREITNREPGQQRVLSWHQGAKAGQNAKARAQKGWTAKYTVSLLPLVDGTLDLT